MAEVIRYVDPDASGSGTGVDWTNAYTSLFAWEVAEQTNLVSAGDWMHVYCRSSSGTADTTACTVNGWTTGASNYILIEAADGDQAVKTGIDTSRYRLTNELQFWETGFIDGLQIASPTISIPVLLYSFSANVYQKMQNCYIEGATDECVRVLGNNAVTTTFENTIITGATNEGIKLTNANASAVTNIDNCIVRNCGTGILAEASTTGVVTNTAVFDCTDDFNATGTLTIDYCASDDGDGTNAIAPSGADWDNEYTDPTNDDFTPLNSGNIFEAGIAISGLTTDMSGNTWNDPPTIGANEYEGTGPPTGIAVLRRRMEDAA